MAGEVVLVIDDSPTIVKVVELVLSKAGYQVETALNGEEGLAAARTKTPSVILLDFVMPRMNGYEACRELSADPKLRDIPVILMSAKGDQIGDRFVKVMGLVDYITKPFSPEAITAVVAHTIEKYSSSSGNAEKPASVAREPQAGDDAAVQASRTAALGELRRQVSDAVAAQVAALLALAHASTDPNGKVSTDVAAIADAARTALNDEALLGMLKAADLPLSASAQPGLSGEISAVPIADVLQLMSDQEQSGLLSVEQGQARVEMYFRRGRVEQALATGVAEEFRFGRFVVGAEIMSRSDFDAFLVRDSQPSPPQSAELLGQMLVKHGHMTESELRGCLAEQSSELIYEILRWRQGQFRFEAGKPLPQTVLDAGLGLDVEAVLMEGYRRVDQWHLVERSIDNADLVFLRNEDSVAHMGRGRLTRDELAVLDLVNGKNTVKDIVQKSRLGSFDVAKLLHQLLSVKLVRRSVRPVAV